MKKILHKIAHSLNLYYGHCDAFYSDNVMMMSFVCNTCGEREKVFPCESVIDREIDFKKQKNILYNQMLDNQEKTNFIIPPIYISEKDTMDLKIQEHKDMIESYNLEKKIYDKQRRNNIYT